MPGQRCLFIYLNRDYFTNFAIRIKMPNKTEWKLEYGFKELPDRREVKPIGRLFILGKYLTVEKSGRYIRALQDKND